MRLLVATFILMPLLAFCQSMTTPGVGQLPQKFDTIAQLVSRPGTNYQTVLVRGYSSVGDWGAERQARFIPGTPASTNRGCDFATTGGRWHFPDCESGEIDVRWFGATGGGVTDDGVTINAAIDYASTNKIVRIPLGSYLLTNFLVLNTGTKLVGDGIGKTYLLRGGTSSQTNSHLYATIQTPAVFNPYVTNGGHVGSVTCTVTNVSLEGFTLTTADGYHPGFGIALFGHQNAKLNNVEITGCTNHWAVTVFGNNTEIRGLQIRNAGWIYRDGIHMLGGDGIAIANCDITSGDDALAFGGGTRLDVSIKNVTVANCVVSSSHGHAVRVAIENASATNAHSGFVISGVVGYAGLQRNGLVYMHSDSTNMTYGINDVTLRGLRLTHGGISGHGGYAVGAAYGVRMTKMNGVLLDDVNVGQTPFRNFFVENCGRVTLSHCTGGGPQTNFIAQPIYANTVSNLRLIGGSFVNENGIDTDTVTLTAVDKFQAIGTAFGHTLATRPCIGLSGAASGDISLVSCTLTNLPGYGIIVSTMPASIVLFNNRFGVTTGIQNANPYRPENVIEAGNIGLSDAFFASTVAANTLSVTNSSASALQSWISNPGTESRVDFRISGTYPQWYSSPFYLWTDTLSNTTDKYFRLGSLHYNTSEEPVFAIVQQSYNGANWIDYGGSSALGNAATQHRWFLGTNATHTAGTNVMRLTYTSTTDETPLSLLVNAALSRVKSSNGVLNIGLNGGTSANFYRGDGRFTNIYVNANGSSVTLPNFIDSIYIQFATSGNNIYALPLNSGVVAGTYSNPSLTVDVKGRITNISSGSAGDEVTVNGSATSNPNFKDGSNITFGLSGSDVTADLTATGVGAASYTYAGGSVTVDAKGRVTGASSGLSPYQIVRGYITNGANVTITDTGTNISISATTGGSTNGTPLYVDTAGPLATANLADSTEVNPAASGTNVTFSIVTSSLATNKIDSTFYNLLMASDVDTATNILVNGTLVTFANLQDDTGAGGVNFVVSGSNIKAYATNVTHGLTFTNGLTNSANVVQWAVAPGANITLTTNNGQITIAASTGVTNSGTGVSVDSGALLVYANLINSSEVDPSVFGTNVSFAIVNNSLETNRLTTNAFIYLLNRANHLNTQPWSTIDSTPTTLGGYGIVNAQLTNTTLTRLGGIGPGAAGDIIYRDATGWTNLAKGTDGDVLTLASGYPNWEPPSVGSSGSYLEKSVTQVVVSNTVDETLLYTWTIPGDTLSTDGDELEIYVPAKYTTYGSQPSGYTWHFYSEYTSLGTPPVVDHLYSDTLSATVETYASDWSFRLKRMSNTEAMIILKHSVGNSVGTNVLANSVRYMDLTFGSGGWDSDKVFALSVEHGVANAGHITHTKGYTVRKLR